jgi:RimJ/RimL family protein N-acetyltransferase
MEAFIELIDTYLSNYSTYNNGKVVFDCDYGELIFFKNNSNILILFGIYIHPEYRQKGLCREILYYLIDKAPSNFKTLCIQSVLSKILYEYLLRFEYKGKKFKITKSGFLYKL